MNKNVQDVKSKQKNLILNGNVGDKKFALELVRSDMCYDLPLLRKLGAWRKANEHWYLAQFAIKTARTRIWLQERVIQDPDRILFLVKVENRYIGHLGLFHFDNNSCEIDNVIRGEAVLPGVMSIAMGLLMDWAKTKLLVSKFTLKVRSENTHAIYFYKKLGFEKTGKIPLVYREGVSGPELVELEAGSKKQGDKYYLIMELTKKNLL